MKGRIIGALWIAAALALAYFGFDGRFFGALIFFCLMMAFAEITSITNGEPWRMQPFAMKHVHEVESAILFLAMFACTMISRQELLLVLVVCMISDVGAFMIGKLFGKHKAKIINHISPKKSYEGYIGGAILPLAAIWLCPVIGVGLTPTVIAYIIVGGLLAEIGDLVGSAAKRRLGVKDSNAVLVERRFSRILEYPVKGHGGYLDRVDSVSLGLVGYVTIQLVASLF